MIAKTVTVGATFELELVGDVRCAHAAVKLTSSETTIAVECAACPRRWSAPNWRHDAGTIAP